MNTEDFFLMTSLCPFAPLWLKTLANLSRMKPRRFNHGETKEHRGFLSDDFPVSLRSSVVKVTALKSKASAP